LLRGSHGTAPIAAASVGAALGGRWRGSWWGGSGGIFGWESGLGLGIKYTLLAGQNEEHHNATTQPDVSHS
jgi:hypothetical protein